MNSVKERSVTLIILLLIIIAAAAFTWSIIHDPLPRHSPAAQALSGGAADTAPYTDLTGNPVALQDEVQGVLVINVWASWSPDSATELVDLARLAETYQDQVSIVAINRAEPASTAERFLREVGATAAMRLVLDPDDSYYRSIGGYAMPETIIYDTAGEVVHHQRGRISYDEMERYVTEALDRSTK